MEMNYFHSLKYVYAGQCCWIIWHKSNKLGLGLKRKKRPVQKNCDGRTNTVLLDGPFGQKFAIRQRSYFSVHSARSLCF